MYSTPPELISRNARDSSFPPLPRGHSWVPSAVRATSPGRVCYPAILLLDAIGPLSPGFEGGVDGIRPPGDAAVPSPPLFQVLTLPVSVGCGPGTDKTRAYLEAYTNYFFGPSNLFELARVLEAFALECVERTASVARPVRLWNRRRQEPPGERSSGTYVSRRHGEFLVLVRTAVTLRNAILGAESSGQCSVGLSLRVHIPTNAH